MFKHFVKWVVLGCALLLLFPANASAEVFKAHGSGSAWNTAQDSNGDGEFAALAVWQGNSSLMGKITVHSRAENLPWDGAYCSPTEILLTPFAGHLVFIAANGHMLSFQTADGGPPGEVCYDIFEGSFLQTSYFQVVGGTGRFADSSGHMTCDLFGKGMFTPLGDYIGAFAEFKCEGEVE